MTRFSSALRTPFGAGQLLPLRWLTALTVVLALALSSAQANDKPLRIDVRNGFVESTYSDAAFVRDAAKLIDSTAGLCEQLFDRSLPDKPSLGVFLYRTLQEYQAADRELTGGNFQDNWAFTAAATQQCHIAMQPRGDIAWSEFGMFPELLETLIVHELGHACAYRLYPESENWPDWLAEGLSEYLSFQHLQKAGKGAANLSLWRQQRISTLHRLMQENRFLGVPELLDFELGGGAKLTIHEAYSEFFCLIAFLMDTKPYAAKARDLVRQCASLGSAPEDRQRARAILKSLYDKDLAAIDAEFRKHVQSLESDWTVIYRDARNTGKEIEVASFPDYNAIVLHNAAVETPAFAWQGETRIQDAGDGQADILFGWRDGRLFKIAIGAAGWISLLEFADDRWTTLKNADADIPRNVWLPVAASVKDGVVEIAVSGKTALKASIADPALAAGRWGIGTTNGVARFRDMQVQGKPVKLKE